MRRMLAQARLPAQRSSTTTSTKGWDTMLGSPDAEMFFLSWVSRCQKPKRVRQIYIYAHTYNTHTYMHDYMITCMHAWEDTYIPTSIPTSMHAFMCTWYDKSTSKTLNPPYQPKPQSLPWGSQPESNTYTGALKSMITRSYLHLGLCFWSPRAM